MKILHQPRLDKSLLPGHLCAVCLSLAVLALTARPLSDWLRFSNTSLESSELWIIPAVAIFVLFSRAKTIFAATDLRTALWALPITVVGIAIADLTKLSPPDRPTVPTLGILIALYGVFLTCYGPRIFWRARFPLSFMIFSVPIPATLLQCFVTWLQHGSAAVVNALLWILRVEYVREGMRFDFPTFAIEIASECSGIRSSFALVVLTFLIAETTLKTWPRKLLLVIAVFPLVLIKNGIRIVTLAMLAMKVNGSFLDGPLHHRGGFVFFGVALAMEAVLCWALVRSERTSGTNFVSTTADECVSVSQRR